ncbi:CAP domain-containing protein [Actinomadura sp. WMMA1423]|uniref:CAP domain-containing protein n=1 Tax=Actinomadura sp. WMMA1423 TaxID=2591108 RepID=UPI001F0F9768|nr:CAP domain-containing protein [Actinomadura sp. WMMA1423]
MVALTAGIAYGVTGSSDGPADSRPVADNAAPAPASPPPAKTNTTPAKPKPTKTAKRSTVAKKPAKPATKRTPKKRPTTPAPRSTAPGGGSGGGGGGTLAQQVVSLTNAERAKNGCGALTVDSRLQAAAQGHSNDMIARNFFDHTNPSGRNPGDRITAAGYRWSTYGENIAYGQRTAAAVMSAWMNSSGHRANILNCRFKNIGVGVALKSGTPYWTQNFGTR